MHEFIPTPKYSPRWYGEKPIAKNIIGDPEELFRPDVLTESSWILWADHGSENPSLLGGCHAVVFWTVTDLLLWLRSHGMPYMQRSNNVGNEFAAVIKEIDQAPAGTDAEELLRDLTARLTGDHGLLEIFGIEPIHDALTREGTVEQFRAVLQDQSITCVGGKWSMARPTWERLWKRLEQNMFEGFGIVERPA